jgi:hypothetical protein
MLRLRLTASRRAGACSASLSGCPVKEGSVTPYDPPTIRPYAARGTCPRLACPPAAPHAVDGRRSGIVGARPADGAATADTFGDGQLVDVGLVVGSPDVGAGQRAARGQLDPCAERRQVDQRGGQLVEDGHTPPPSIHRPPAPGSPDRAGPRRRAREQPVPATARRNSSPRPSRSEAAVGGAQVASAGPRVGTPRRPSIRSAPATLTPRLVKAPGGR